MKFGVREICDIVLRAKSNQWIGKKYFYQNEPVIYFDTLKTSSMEGAATTVYAQGGRGNARLVAWEGERTVTFIMEDALISPEGFSILTGAGLIEADESKPIYVHTTEIVKYTKDSDKVTAVLKGTPCFDAKCNVYVFPMKNGEIFTEPYTIGVQQGDTENTIIIPKVSSGIEINDISEFNDEVCLVDYYTKKQSAAMQIDITPDQFGGFYYLEASTLFRNEEGRDMPAEFIIPKCKIQSNFTFTMASSGDPSTFTFTMDAFPDYTRFDKTKKVFAAVQVITDQDGKAEEVRTKTNHDYDDVVMNHLTFTISPRSSDAFYFIDGQKLENQTFNFDIPAGALVKDYLNILKTNEYQPIKPSFSFFDYSTSEDGFIDDDKLYISWDITENKWYVVKPYTQESIEYDWDEFIWDESYGDATFYAGFANNSLDSTYGVLYLENENGSNNHGDYQYNRNHTFFYKAGQTVLQTTGFTTKNELLTFLNADSSQQAAETINLSIESDAGYENGEAVSASNIEESITPLEFLNQPLTRIFDNVVIDDFNNRYPSKKMHVKLLASS